MKELVKITEQNGKQAVNARDLHHFLITKSIQNEVGEQFNHWIKRMIDYGSFELGLDYDVIEYDYTGAEISQSDNKRVSKRDFIISLDCAKEISMLQRNDKGKQARRYFIEVEKSFQSNRKSIPQSFSEALLLAAKQAEEIEQKQRMIEAQRPKVLFADAVSASKSTILIGELAKILKQNGIEIGQNRLFTWLRNKGYLISRRGTDYNSPTQRAMDLGLFKIKESSITHADGHISINKTTKVTGKGQTYFINQFLSKSMAIAQS